MTRPFDAVMNGLREDLFRMGGRCEAILDKSLRSVWNRDAALAAEVRVDDLAFVDARTSQRVLPAGEYEVRVDLGPSASGAGEVVHSVRVASDVLF